MIEQIRVLIADDHPIVREGLEVVLASEDDMELVAQATNGDEAVRLAQETRPDVIIMDLQMPVKDGLTAIREIGEANLDAQILVLTSFPDDTRSLPPSRRAPSGSCSRTRPRNICWKLSEPSTGAKVPCTQPLPPS
jgi:DNA-binding NarL/FixJ family response regulator